MVRPELRVYIVLLSFQQYELKLESEYVQSQQKGRSYVYHLEVMSSQAKKSHQLGCPMVRRNVCFT